MQDYTKTTLGELLTHPNETIKRNAMSILKTLQKGKEYYCKHYEYLPFKQEDLLVPCGYCKQNEINKRMTSKGHAGRNN